MLSLFNPYAWLGAAALAVSAWGAWQWHGNSRYEAGKAEVMAQWRAADQIAQAVGNETTALLKRANARNIGALDEKLKRIDQEAKARAVGLADAVRTIDGLRLALDERAAAPPDSDIACPAARRDAAKLRSCEGLLSGSLDLAQSAGRLVDEGENLLERGNAALESLQEWSRLVQTANEAP